MMFLDDDGNDDDKMFLTLMKKWVDYVDDDDDGGSIDERGTDRCSLLFFLKVGRHEFMYTDYFYLLWVLRFSVFYHTVFT